MPRLRFIWLLLAGLLCATSTVIAAEKPVVQKPISFEKDTSNSIEAVKTFLHPRSVDGAAKVWIFFTDKGVFDKAAYQRIAASVTLTDEKVGRLEKMGIDGITFADLPVPATYINDIIEAGGELRRISKWLNAASFLLPLDQIDQINQLPFVAKIRPVATFVRENAEEVTAPDSKTAPPQKSGDPGLLGYGNAFGQLDMIGVPEAHALGFNGAGVIVAMFDTGYRKSHEAFAAAIGSGRLIAEYDFVYNDSETANEAEDWSSAWNHGTYTWSTLGGAVEGTHYGPAYGASFLLAKTEDVRSETQVEEDNWVAAVEWADSIGADVISSSLGYSDWYAYSDFDGETAITTLAANLATSMGIVVVNSNGNGGPGSGTMTAPADAFEILACGAVSSTGTIASFSSRGPTYDGRIKPDVSAQGVSTYCATSSGDANYTYVNGTSLSCPLVGGAAAIVLQARPSFTPQMVRLALMETASMADSPNNDYGWGIIDVVDALGWGADFTADVTMGQAPLTVNFTDQSMDAAKDWQWDFGDGDYSTERNPTHTFDQPGAFNVSLTIDYQGIPITNSKTNYIVAIADTMHFEHDTAFAGTQAVIDVNLANSQELGSLMIPFAVDDATYATIDSASVVGTRTDGFIKSQVAATTSSRAYFITNPSSPLPPGAGTVMKIFFTLSGSAPHGTVITVDTATVSSRTLELTADGFSYVPEAYEGSITVNAILRGDANSDGLWNIGDAVFLINFIYNGGPEPASEEAGDANLDLEVNVGDAIYLINYIFKGGPAPLEF